MLFHIREYEAKAIIRSKPNYFSLIKSKLDKKRRKLFRATCFGKWLDLSYFDHEPHMIDYILQKQCCPSDAHYDMPIVYYVEDRPLHFGRPEFCLITGFRFGNVSFNSFKSGHLNFRNRVFPNHVGKKVTSLDIIGLIEDEQAFGIIYDEDAVRLCLLLALDVIFMGRLLVEEVDDTLFRLIENLDDWDTFPWGEYIWRRLYDQFLDVPYKHKYKFLEGINKDRKFVPTYTLSGFVWAFKIWILESFEEAFFGGIKFQKWYPEEYHDQRIQHLKYQNISTFLKRPLAERKCDWYIQFMDYFHHYIPRTPPVKTTHLADEYFKKLAAARRRGKIERKHLPIIRKSESSLVEINIIQDGVITELNARLFKLKGIIQVLARERNGERLVFDDDLRNLSSEFCDELNDCFLELFQSSMDTELEKLRLKERKLREEQKRLMMEEDKMIRMQEEKMLQDESERKKKAVALKNSNHWKNAVARIAPTKRSESFGEANAYYWTKAYAEKAERKAQCFGLLNPDMTEQLKHVKLWVEDLKRLHKAVNKVYFTDENDRYLGQIGPLNCKFPWCEDVTVDRRFWESLVCLDPKRQGWLLEEASNLTTHIELWVNYMWHVRLHTADWAMVSGYFVQLLLQNSLPLWYANGERYSIPWSDVKQVFMPINEMESHWFVARFEIERGLVTFYDGGQVFVEALPDFYYQVMDCLQSQLPKVLSQAQVFQKKGIDPSTYNITFYHLDKIPKQSGIFGDCGIWVVSFYIAWLMDPVQAALAYREQMAKDSHNVDEFIFEVWHGSVFMVLPLRYAGGEVINLKLPKSCRLSYFEMCDLLLKNIKADIWAWFYCKPGCSLEEGLTIVETDSNVKKMFELADIHGLIEVFISAIPQSVLVDHYYKNLLFDDSDVEVTARVIIHEKRRNDLDNMNLEEIKDWEQSEQNSPDILRTPYVKEWTEASEASLFRGKGELEYNDDFNDCPSFLRSVNNPYMPKDCKCGCRSLTFLRSLAEIESGFGSSPIKGNMVVNDVDDGLTVGSSTVIQNVSKEIGFKAIPFKGNNLFNEFEDAVSSVGGSTVIQHVLKEIFFEASPLKSKNLFNDFEEALDDDIQDVAAVSVVGGSNAIPYVSTEKKLSESSPLNGKRLFNKIHEVPTIGGSTVIHYASKKRRCQGRILKGRKLFDDFQSVGSHGSVEYEGFAKDEKVANDEEVACQDVGRTMVKKM
ncbi:phospholipase-like protein [Artemisia annua]|uniref:Phospholipase-like protein n=1 Tax=Artemisia annua TaxID=35608 RepID=A0A2U1N7J3_ARTAN|nr:phospholipase-like protein [Artemisia annua]